MPYYNKEGTKRILDILKTKDWSSINGRDGEKIGTGSEFYRVFWIGREYTEGRVAIPKNSAVGVEYTIQDGAWDMIRSLLNKNVRTLRFHTDIGEEGLLGEHMVSPNMLVWIGMDVDNICAQYANLAIRKRVLVPIFGVDGNNCGNSYTRARIVFDQKIDLPLEAMEHYKNDIKAGYVLEEAPGGLHLK